MAERNLWAGLTRAGKKLWFGENGTSEVPPLAINNDYVKSLNAAGTGTVDLIKANASDAAELPAGTVLTAPVLSVVNDSTGLNRLVVNATPKTIVDGSATSLFEVGLANNTMVGGVIFYQVEAASATEFQSLVGMVTYAAVAKAAAHTLVITEVAGNQAKAVSSGTLTLAWTFVTGTGKGTVKLQPTGSLTETTYRVTYSVLPFKGAVTIV